MKTTREAALKSCKDRLEHLEKPRPTTAANGSGKGPLSWKR